MSILVLLLLILAQTGRTSLAFAPSHTSRCCDLSLKTTAPAATSDLPDPSTLSVKEIKGELQERGVSFADCFDKESLVVRLKELRAKKLPTNDESVKGDVQSTAPATRDDSDLVEEIRSMKVRELREELAHRNLRWAGLLEKEDLVQAVLKARRRAAEFSVTGAISPGEVGELTGDQLELELAEMNSPLLLDAYAVWCGPCKMMAPQLGEASKILWDRVRVAKMDTDKHPLQSSTLRVQGLPTLILFKNGKELARIEGALMRDQIVQWVESKL